MEIRGDKVYLSRQEKLDGRFHKDSFPVTFLLEVTCKLSELISTDYECRRRALQQHMTEALSPDDNRIRTTEIAAKETVRDGLTNLAEKRLREQIENEDVFEKYFDIP